MNISSETSPLLPSCAPPSSSRFFDMSRSSTFQTAARQALTKHPSAKLNEDEVRGPVSWLNPTHALFELLPRSADSASRRKDLRSLSMQRKDSVKGSYRKGA